MRFTQAIVLASFLSCAVIVGAALSGTSGMKTELSQNPLSTIALAIPCAWPWMRAYAAAGDDNNTLKSLVFSGASIGIAALLYKNISTAPAEGIGLNVIFCLFLIWLARVVIFRFLPD